MAGSAFCKSNNLGVLQKGSGARLHGLEVDIRFRVDPYDKYMAVAITCGSVKRGPGLL